MIDLISGKDTDTGSVPNTKKDSKAGFVVTLLCLMAVAVGGGYWVRTHGQPAATAVDPAASEAAVRAVDAQWAKAAAAHDVDGTIAFYSDDAIVMPPNSPMAQDKGAERKAWAAILVPGADITWTAGKVVAAQSGELVYDVGMYTVITKASKGKPQTTDGGKYLAVWKKQADGSWKAVASTWNSDKSAPTGKRS
jgi:ketosteroid isomerase-like protein